MFINQIKTVLLLGALSGIILIIGGFFGGTSGLTIALIFAILMNFFSYFYSHKLVLAMYKAQPITKKQAPEIHEMVEEISKKAGIPKPKIYAVPSENPNAFATGRNPQNAIVAVTIGITKLLSKEELKSVLAHEIGHIKNRDILIATIAATLASVITYIAMMARFAVFFGGGRDENGSSNAFQLIALAILAPIAAMLIQFAISRSREFMADETSARLTNDKKHMMSALNKIEQASKAIPLRFGNKSTASLFIINPFLAKGFTNLFSTHPTTQARVERLGSLEL
jgi:heat shock protein HtpX